MSRKELLIAGLLLAVAVVGGASIPRLLASPAAPLGIALGPGPGSSVVQTPTISAAPHHAASRHSSSALSQASATPVKPVTQAAVQPSSTASVAQPKHVTAPPAAPVTTVPHPATAAKQPPAAVGRNPSAPATPPGQGKKLQGPEMMTPPGHLKTPPGHAKTPPGQLPRAAHGKPTLTGGQRDLPGSGHGRQVPEVPPHAVGHHDRGLGHLPQASARSAAAAGYSRAHARPEAGGSRGQGGHEPSAPPVAHGQGHNGNGKGSGD
jgi:hypothetical protein